jgi:cytochrome c-type biogenesis protein CcmF
VVLLLAGSPFRRLGVTPVDGAGLDSMLRGSGLFVERPLAIVGLGTAGIVVAQLLGGARVERAWRWIVVSWLLLGAATGVGLWRAYELLASVTSPGSSATRAATISLWAAASLLVAGVLVNRRREARLRLTSPGPALLALGVVLLGTGALASRFGPARELRLQPGATASLASAFGAPYSLTHMGLSRFQTSDRMTAAATLDIDRNDIPLGLVISERRQYVGALGQPTGEPVTRMGIRRGPLEDLRVVFREAGSGEEVLYQVRVLPLASFIWLGAGLLLVGGLFLMARDGE